MLRKTREIRGFDTQTQGSFLECFETKFEQHFPLTWRESAQNKWQILLEIATKTFQDWLISVSA
jgi:hypothetical protein